MNITQIIKTEKTHSHGFFLVRPSYLQQRAKRLDIYLSYLIGVSMYRENFYLAKKTIICLFKRLTKLSSLFSNEQNNNRIQGKDTQLNFLLGNIKTTNNLQIEICSDKIIELLLNRQICAADIRCLDNDSKQCLKKMCLKTCLINRELNTSNA